MTIIDSLSNNYEDYLNNCLDVLTTKIDIIDLDFSTGETDVTRLLFIEKKDSTEYHAVAILTMRLMMMEEEWNDLKRYTKEDIERWMGILKTQYESSLYLPNIEIAEFKSNFFVERLTTKKGLKSVEHNGQVIDFLTFKRTNPLFHEQIMHVSKTKFKGLQEEFYIETSHHFVLFSWFTTA
jgi:hypothetical protein